MLRTQIHAVKPLPSAVIPANFFQSRIEEVKVPIYSKEGKKLRDITERRTIKEVIPPTYFFDPSLTKDMFTLTALQSAGVPLVPVTTKQLGNDDLSQLSAVTDFVEGVDYEQLFDSKETKQETTQND